MFPKNEYSALYMWNPGYPTRVNLFLWGYCTIHDQRSHAGLSAANRQGIYNGLWHLSIIGCGPSLAGLLSVLPLKSKLVSTVLGPWFVDTTAKTSTMTPSIVLGPPSPWRQIKPWDVSGDCRSYECRSVAVSDGPG